MIKVRPYLLVLGFVTAAFVVAYEIAISCGGAARGGVRELGLGTMTLGAVFACLAGQSATQERKVCTKPPLRIRVARAINRQAASPSGPFGRLLGLIWRREHARVNAEVLDRLDVLPGHRVLEVGSGPGEALHDAARRARGGKVVGIDVSVVMIRLASDRNRRGVARGEVELRRGDGITLGLEGETFDRIFSVHCIYFWRDRDRTLAELAAALRPRGTLVLAFRPEGSDIPARFRDPTYRFPRAEDVEATMRRVGLDVAASERSNALPSVIFVKATRR